MEYKIGQTAEFSKTITEADVYAFAGIVGDFNPVHVNSVEAAKSIFGERVAHGALIAGLISNVLGNKLPGAGTIYLNQNSYFRKPVKINDTVTVRVTLDRIESGHAFLSTNIFNQKRECVLEGTAEVKLPV